MPQPRQRSPLYCLTAYGWSEWNVWALQEGGLSEWCPRCTGRGIVVDSPCFWREASEAMLGARNRGRCAGAESGCASCRHRCPSCRGARLRREDVVRAEDFGDQESFDAALAMFPGLDVDPRRRMDMEAQAL